MTYNAFQINLKEKQKKINCTLKIHSGSKFNMCRLLSLEDVTFHSIIISPVTGKLHSKDPAKTFNMVIYL